ncbi:type II CAAX endopeptidase family protein [Nonomuraea sp. NPDC055795]
MRSLVAILATLVMFFAVALSPALFPGATGMGVLAYALMPALVAPALLFLYRRFVDRRPWQGLRTAVTWWSLPQFAAGAVLGLAALLVANALAVSVGAAAWTSLREDQTTPLNILLVIVVFACKAGYPEELMFRGHLFDVLSDRYRPMAVLVVTSVVFGAPHIVSQSPADGVVERLLYVVMAIALGFLCGALRLRSGAVWTAAGAHTSVYLIALFPAREIDFGIQLIFQTVLLSLAAGAVLLISPRKGSSAARSRAQTSCPSPGSSPPGTLN